MMMMTPGGKVFFFFSLFTQTKDIDVNFDLHQIIELDLLLFDQSDV